MTTTPKLHFLPGNTITTLVNGEETYPAMLKAIHKAKTSIYFANFCVQKGKASDLFYQPLLNAARRGVKIYILLDAYGAEKTDPKHLSDMRTDHIDIAWFNPRQKLRPLRYNKRLHKKLLIVDNIIGFTGGIGIADLWLNGANYPAPWRDTHFQLKGPIVGEMAGSFIRSWNRFSTVQLPEQKPITAPAKEGTVPMALVDTAPLSPTNRDLTTLYEELIRQAIHSIDISTAYFGPAARLRRSLVEAANRGVKIRILTNGPHPSHQVAMQAGRSYYMGLLRAGTEIYEYQPTKTHSKLIVIDGETSVLGSANLNSRSFRHDEEAIILAKSANLATTLTEQFEADLKKSKKINIKTWQYRPITEKAMQTLASGGRYFF